MNCTVKPLTAADCDLLWAKLDEIWPSEEDAREELLVFKAEDDEGEMIGGCVLSVDMTKNAEFNSLWVDERFRRCGAGSALIRKAERAAYDRGCRLIINAYNFDFQPARPLFEKHGYKLCGIFRDWPGGHEGYALEKKLSGAAAECARFPKETGFAIVRGSEEDGERITALLREFNDSVVPRSHPYADIDRKLVDDRGCMIAGCIAGVSGWDVLHIDLFWEDEAYRDTGAGSCLLWDLEREARSIGARIARAEAADSRYEAFFRKCGYEPIAAYDGESGWSVMEKKL